MTAPEWVPEEVAEVLDSARCAICPNAIGRAPFHMLTDPAVIGRLVALEQGTVINTPDGVRMLVHVQCLENARAVAGP